MCVCVFMHAHVCHGMCMVVRGQLHAVCSLLPPSCRFQDWTQVIRLVQQVPQAAEPSFRHTPCFLRQSPSLWLGAHWVGQAGCQWIPRSVYCHFPHTGIPCQAFWCGCWGSNSGPLSHGASTLPLSHLLHRLCIVFFRRCVLAWEIQKRMVILTVTYPSLINCLKNSFFVIFPTRGGDGFKNHSSCRKMWAGGIDALFQVHPRGQGFPYLFLYPYWQCPFSRIRVCKEQENLDIFRQNGQGFKILFNPFFCYFFVFLFVKLMAIPQIILSLLIPVPKHKKGLQEWHVSLQCHPTGRALVPYMVERPALMSVCVSQGSAIFSLWRTMLGTQWVKPESPDQRVCVFLHWEHWTSF